MDRCALFVDASYALADGALAVHGTRNRDSVSWDYAGLLKLLGSLSRDRSGLPLLRCYWYDAADGDRAAEHDTLADIPGVKLRLSKARPSRKEGVEAEIRKDLTALARNRAVSDVIIVSVEEDLGPVIAEVQDLGIRTILLHIGTDGDWAMSRSLRQECDDVIELAPGHLRPYVDLISGAEPQLANAGYRELAAGATQSSGSQPAIEAPAVRLYGSPVVAEYQHVGQLAGVGNAQGQDQRDLTRSEDATRFGGQVAAGQAEVLGARTVQRPDGLPSSVQDQQLQTAGLLQAQAMQAEAARAQPAQAQQYQHDLSRGQAAASGDAGFGDGGYASQDPSRGQNGQLSHQQEVGYAQRSAGEDGREQPGSLPGVAVGQPVMHGQSGLGQNAMGQPGLGQNGMGQNGMGQNGMGPNGMGQNGMGPRAWARTARTRTRTHRTARQVRLGRSAMHPVAASPVSVSTLVSSRCRRAAQWRPVRRASQWRPVRRVRIAGRRWSAGRRPAAGGAVPGNGLPPGGLHAQGTPAHGMPTDQAGGLPGQGAGMHGNGLQSSGMQPGGLPPAGLAPGGGPPNGAANGLAQRPGRHADGRRPAAEWRAPSGRSQQPGMPVAGQQGPLQPAQGSPLPGSSQPVQGQPIQGRPIQGSLCMASQHRASLYMASRSGSADPWSPARRSTGPAGSAAAVGRTNWLLTA